MNLLIKITVLLLLAFSHLSYAANDTESFKTASDLLKAEKPSEALAFLLTNHEVENASAQEWFLLGVASKQSGNLEQATQYFEKVLEIDPNAARVKLELASVAYQLGNRDKAKLLLLDVKASNPPADVRGNIDRFLATLESVDNQKNWRLTTALGWTYDSNVNSGPQDSVITMYGLPFTLSDDAKPNDDQAYTFSVALDHAKQINTVLGWQSNIGVNLRDNIHLDNLDTLYLYASTGPVWQQSKQATWSIPLFGDVVRYGHQDRYLSFSYGLAPQIRYLVSDGTALNVTTSLSKKIFHDQGDRNQISWGITPSVDFQISSGNSVRFGLATGGDHSDIDYYNNDHWFLTVNYIRKISDTLIASLNGSHGQTSYKGKETAYNDVRKDTRSSIGLNLRYHVAKIDMDVILATFYATNHSNLAIYDYDQKQLSVNLSKSF